MHLKIVAIGDLHYSQADPTPERHGAIGDILFERAVNRINRFIKPDIVILTGDLIDQNDGADAEQLWQRLRAIADRLECPLIALPGNHDGDPQAFYRVFPDPGEMLDIKGARFLVFLDPEEPGWNARRTPHDLARMEAAAAHQGPTIALQHTSLFPPGTSDCPFNCTNAGEIVARMRKHGIQLAISGHYHPGADLIRHGAGSFVIAPALCEPPFAFLEVDLSGERISVRRHELRVPPEHRLIDCHVHTPFAYCAEDIGLARAVSLAEDFGLAGLAFTEHSGQLYFDRETYWQGRCLRDGVDCRVGRQNRMGQYLTAVGEHSPPAIVGLETDCDYAGRPMLRDEDRSWVALLAGAVHSLPELRKPKPQVERAADEFLAALTRFLASGLQVYVHPFRVFRGAGLSVPQPVVEQTVQLLREHKVAAEINFHMDEPTPEFVRLCVESGVKLVFGSDAHALSRVGEFWPHLELLRQCGYHANLPDVLSDLAISPPDHRPRSDSRAERT